MLFEYKGTKYPEYLRKGNAVSFILPIAQFFCKGRGLDVGGLSGWSFPGATLVNVENKDGYHAMKLPGANHDFVFSSHTLEHLKDPFYAIKYWSEVIRPGGAMFLYLPHPNQRYWAVDNPKHLHVFTPSQIKYWMEDAGLVDVLVSGQDMYWSFAAVGFKR